MLALCDSMRRLLEALKRWPFDVAIGIVLIAMLTISFIVTRHYVPPARLGSGVSANSPYTTERWWADKKSQIASIRSVLENDWNGTDFNGSKLAGFIVIGSYSPLTGDAYTGHLSLRLHRGDRVLFRSGPTIKRQTITIKGQPRGRFSTALPLAPDWTILEFTNSHLPQVFTAVFEDAGPGWGEWSAVALSLPRT